MPAPFRIYSASAGSGKTYQLTKEYLKLALGYPQPADPTGARAFEPDYFKRVLAITFTNDAAGEMKERIVGALRGFAQGGGAGSARLLAEVAGELAAEGQLPKRLATPEARQQEVRRRATATFRLVLYHYADFAVGTIDSFVQRIVTAFTRELGLPASFEVELDTESVLRSAVAGLLDRVNRGADSRLLSDTLADYALGQAEEGRSWQRLPDELLDFGKVLFNESVHEAVAQLGRLELKDFQQLGQDIKGRLGELEAEVQARSSRALALLDGAGVEAAHLANGATGIHSHFANWQRWLQAPEKDKDFPTATALKIVDTGKWVSAAGRQAGRTAAIEAVQGELAELFGELQVLRGRYLSPYLLLRAMQPFLFHASLLSELSKLVDSISRERGVVLISEFNRRIAAIVLSEPVPFIYERLGEKYRHLLIDEFQDTSVLQWNNLLPLVESAVGNGGLSLAVGDAKQAIYRWRGGELEQILRLYQQDTPALAARARDPEMRRLLGERYQTLQRNLEPQSLAVNYRSEPAIVGFNNDFFGYVRERGSEGGLVGGIFADGFEQAVPGGAGPVRGTAGQGLAGHVELLFTHPDAPARHYDPATGGYGELLPGYPTGATLDYNESTCFLTLALVEQARADGYQLADVAVLCRTRKQSRLLAKFLKERGYPIISADSLALQFAETVNLVVAVMRVLQQGADTLARAEALLLVDKVVRHLAPTPARARHIAEVANDQTGSRPFWDELRALGYDVDEPNTGNLGLYELAEQLIGLFGLLAAGREGDYLFRFLDLTLDYSLRYGNNLGNFLTYWDERKGSLSINAPGGADAVTITTVHKAKGLAYGIVVLPFADWTLVPMPGTRLWGRLEADDKPLPALPDVAVVSLNAGLQYTALAAQRLEEQEKTLLDGLNTLYVAFTRPRHQLYAISKAPADKPAGKAGELPAAPGPALPEPAAAQKPPRDVADLLAGYLRHLGRWQEARTSFVLSQGGLQSAVNSQQLTGSSQQVSVNSQQVAVNSQQVAVNSQQVAVNSQQVAINNQQVAVDNQQVTGSGQRPETGSQQPEASNEQPTTYPLHNLATADWHDRLKLRRHAGTVFGFDRQEALGELNRKLHYALRRLLSARDLPRALRQLVAEGIISPKEREPLRERLQALLDDPRLAPYFADDLAVETEREILVGGHTVRPYKPDRIVLGGPGGDRAGQVVTLLDFKLPPPRDADKTHLRDYARLFRELGYGQVQGLIYYFGTEEVVTI